MNKKLLGIIFITTALLLAFPTKADTTGTVNTGTVNTGTNITGNCYPVISGLVISVVCTTGNVNTGTVNTGTVNTGTVNTGIVNTGIINTGTATGTIIIPTSTITTGTEFEKALSWMYANGLTKYSNKTDYRADDGLTREEAAKIIGQAFVTLGYNQDTKNNNCGFTDSNEVDSTLAAFVINTCKRGIFKGTTDGKFLPREKLTRPQSMALLVRIFEGKVSNESRIPRWGDYYVKGQALGLTTLNTQTAFDTEITREEIAIYIWRLKEIVTNETVRLMMLSKLTELNTKNTTNTGILDNFGSLADSLSVNNDPELFEAIRWMNDNGLTNYKTITEYKPFEILNREQAAKILSMFASVFGFSKIDTTSISCVFDDIDVADASLTTYIQQVCNLGIMQGSNGYFNPKENITKSQFIASIIRLFEGKKLDETTNPRWTKYFEKAQQMGMVSPADAITFDNAITRYEVALFLYRFKVKYQILQNLNNDTVQNQVVSTVPGSITTGTNNMPQSNVYVDMNLLTNGNFDVGYIEMFGQRYKVVESNTEKYFTNNFVRYGDIFSLDKEEKIGTINFIVSSLSLIEGTIRLGDSTFVISPISNTNAYYKITKTK